MLATEQKEGEQNVDLQAANPSVPVAKTTASLAATALLAACGGGGGADSGPVSSGETSADVAKPATAAEIDAARFLQQAQFSSTQAEITDVLQTTQARWLKRQMDAPQGQTGWEWLEMRGYGLMDTNRYFSTTYQADFMLWNQLMSGPEAMRKRMALALSELFVVSLDTAEYSWRSHAFAHYWDTLVKNAFGNFRQLLEDVTLHPAMGYYLNTKGNQKENTSSGRTPDENYAREVMQLFTIGLHQLNPDGTEKRDAGGNPIETYAPPDVAGLARVFTGYDFDRSDGVRITITGQTATVESRDFARKPMSFDAGKHSSLAATFLGVTVEAGTSGPEALKTALDTLFNHPNAGPFFARQMIQRLVTSNPSAAYVGRVAARFNRNDAGVRGDLRTVWTAILLDPEARGVPGVANPGFGKLREPMLRLIQWARSFGVTSAAGSWKIFNTSNPATQLGQSPLRAPSVFNFFRPGFVPPNTIMAAAQAPAPEFQLVNETTVSAYLNYMQTVIRGGISCPKPDVPEAALGSGIYQLDVKPDYAGELALASNAALVSHLGLVLCAGSLLPATQNLIVSVLNARPVTSDGSDALKLDRVAVAVLMVMASADYLIQK
ncbi:DUF1800 domain-containing protein [Polaromonas glacialis]|uniref:DUF1800 domain-containing protein n=1 Tax=Polaromonas glacialis TaxID=866564 RepID=UPI000495CCF8|nr:DUF1800 domain-containing protein [Polaromonas glacialis]